MTVECNIVHIVRLFVHAFGLCCFVALVQNVVDRAERN